LAAAGRGGRGGCCRLGCWGRLFRCGSGGWWWARWLLPVRVGWLLRAGLTSVAEDLRQERRSDVPAREDDHGRPPDLHPAGQHAGHRRGGRTLGDEPALRGEGPD